VLPKLAVVATHPIQYYGPWFAHLARQARIAVKPTQQLGAGRSAQSRQRRQYDGNRQGGQDDACDPRPAGNFEPQA